MRLRDYLDIARERLVVAIAIVAVTAAAVVGLLLVQEPVMTASVRIRARPPAAGSAINNIALEQQQQTDLGTEGELLRGSEVAAAVAAQLELAGSPDDLLDRVTATPLGTTAVLRVDATASTSAEAIALANAFADNYLKIRRKTLSQALDAETASVSKTLQQDLGRLSSIDKVLAGATTGSAAAIAAQAERDQVVADLTVARSRLGALADRAALNAGFGEIIQPAREASASRSQSVPRALVFGMLLGIPLALAAVLVLDGISNDVRSAQDAARAAGTDVIGVIPLDPSWSDPAAAVLATNDAPLSPTAEAYRRLSFTLTRTMDAEGLTSVLVTSPGDGEGKSVTVANLAVATADTGRPTRVVEADLRHPRLHTFLGGQSAPGLADVLAGEVSMEIALQELGPGLELLAAGRASERPDLLVGRGDLGAVLDSVRPTGARSGRARAARPPLVLIDSASVLEAAEVSRLAAQADGVVLLARARTTPKHALAAAADQVRRVGGTVLGVVLIGARSVAESASPEHPGFAPAARPSGSD